MKINRDGSSRLDKSSIAAGGSGKFSDTMSLKSAAFSYAPSQTSRISQVSRASSSRSGIFMNNDKLYQKHLQNLLLELPKPKNKVEIDYENIINDMVEKIEQ